MSIYKTTNSAFLVLYLTLLIENTAWTAGPRLDDYMEEIRSTMTTNRVSWTGVTDLAKLAYAEVGGRRKATLERIRDLPSGPAFLPMALFINLDWPDRDGFIAWLESHGLKPLATDQREDSLVDGAPAFYGKNTTAADRSMKALWRHYSHASSPEILAVAAQ